MKRELLVLRHARSERDGTTGTDFERPLANRGRKDAPLMGRWLRDQGLLPDLVLSSPAMCAEQTIRAVVAEAGISDARRYCVVRDRSALAPTVSRRGSPDPCRETEGHRGMTPQKPDQEWSIDLKHPDLYINRELSHVEFNRRVLLQAENEDVPLLDILTERA